MAPRRRLLLMRLPPLCVTWHAFTGTCTLLASLQLRCSAPAMKAAPACHACTVTFCAQAPLHRPVGLCHPPLQVYPQVAPVLVQRFKEREETVKQDVFQVGGAPAREGGATHATGRGGQRGALANPLRDRRGQEYCLASCACCSKPTTAFSMHLLPCLRTHHSPWDPPPPPRRRTSTCCARWAWPRAAPTAPPRACCAPTFPLSCAPWPGS